MFRFVRLFKLNELYYDDFIIKVFIILFKDDKFNVVVNIRDLIFKDKLVLVDDEEVDDDEKNEVGFDCELYEDK